MGAHRRHTVAILLDLTRAMIVYGSPQHVESMGAFAAQLRARLEAVRRSPAPWSRERLRTLLIMAGQPEQAAHDAPPGEAAGHWQARLAALHTITGHAAAFYGAWASEHEAAPDAHCQVQGALAEMARTLDTIRGDEGARLAMAVPEGFAFHALYPEQYAASARRWVREQAAASSRRAVVVGVRTIGTALAAVVAAALAAGGWQVRSLTVRPQGHPFARTVEVDPSQIGDADWGLVVDEGPGLSGSSMAAVAEGLIRAGVPGRRLSFFPSHGGEPGRAASEAVRRWWAATPRYMTPLHRMRFAGRPLPERLADAVTLRCGAHDPVVRVEDLSGGLWRHTVYPQAGMWPPVCPPFERLKYRVTTAHGWRFLWKFAGLSLAPGGAATMAERAAARMTTLARLGFGPWPLGVVEGFVVARWVEGRPLTQADADAGTLAHIGRYLARTAGPSLSAGEAEEHSARLMEMLYWNTREALGEAAAARARRFYERCGRAAVAGRRHAYGDGHVSPHEWLRRPDGGLVKVDSDGHDIDPTVVGRQSIAWDVAGALVEWGLNETAAAPLLEAFHAAGGDPLCPAEIAFHRLAYAAFRAGQCQLCADACEAAERRRLRRAYERYRDDLARTLAALPAADS
jgi:hypothetical protein